jgi:hypothetical protein
MPQWHRKQIVQKNKGVSFRYSLVNSLRAENKSNPEFEFMVNNLTLEELIGLKLELSSKMLNGKLAGMKLWKSIPMITRQAMVTFAESCTKTRYDAATLLGVSIDFYLNSIIKKYKTKQ